MKSIPMRIKIIFLSKHILFWEHILILTMATVNNLLGNKVCIQFGSIPIPFGINQTIWRYSNALNCINIWVHRHIITQIVIQCEAFDFKGFLCFWGEISAVN